MIVERGSRMVARLRQGWHREVVKCRAMNESEVCLPSDMASEVGLAAPSCTPICSHRGPSELLPERLRLLGVDPEYVRHAAPTMFGELARVCASCKDSPRCARDLGLGNAQAGMDDYCLNGRTIDALTLRETG